MLIEPLLRALLWAGAREESHEDTAALYSYFRVGVKGQLLESQNLCLCSGFQELGLEHSN